jgi:hypothetical protein
MEGRAPYTSNVSKAGLLGLAKEAPSGRRRTIGVVVAILAALIMAAFVAGYLYWKSFEDTPQYSLAMLVDAARRGDQAGVDKYVDTSAVVDDFVPQIASKAAELYGRGIPPQVIDRLKVVARPILPAVKERARAELPRVIRERTDKFESVPFAGLVVGADRYLDVAVEGDTALVRSKLPEHSFEVKMRRTGREWQIVGVRDETLATDIARKVGQEMIAIATDGVGSRQQRLGAGNLAEMLRQAEEALR